MKKKALQIYETDPETAVQFLTQYTELNVEKMLQQYTQLRHQLLEKYSNNVLGY